VFWCVYCDTDKPTNTINDLLHVSISLITRYKIKALKGAMNEFVTKVLARADFGDPLKHHDEVLIHLIQVQEEPNPCSS
jgi:hypothetical protein